MSTSPIVSLTPSCGEGKQRETEMNKTVVAPVLQECIVYYRDRHVNVSDDTM